MTESYALIEISISIDRLAKTLQQIHASKLEANINEEYFPERSKELLKKFIHHCVAINNSR